VNFFPPSFKLKSKTRQGARVLKRYHTPATPYERFLASDQISAAAKEPWRACYEALDPIRLLEQIRKAQGRLAALASGPQPSNANSTAPPPNDFLSALRTAWQEGEIRPTHRKKVAVRDWRTRQDPFEAVWPPVLNGLEEQPNSQAKDLFLRLPAEFPDNFADGQLRTLQRRIKQWRSEIARRLVMGSEETLLPPDDTDGPGRCIRERSVPSAMPMTEPRKARKTPKPGFPFFPTLLGNPAHGAGFPHSHSGGDGESYPIHKNGITNEPSDDNYDAVTFFVEATRSGVFIFVDQPAQVMRRLHLGISRVQS